MSNKPQLPTIKLDQQPSEIHDISGRNSVSPSRPSLDSIISRATSNSTTFAGTNRNQFSMDSKSGSRDYSPLGNNSIYEVVMNTRRRDWLRPPTAMDIPPVSISKNEIIEGWSKIVGDYVDDIAEEEITFRSRNNIRNMNTLEQIKQLEETDTQMTPNGPTIIEQIPDFYFEKVFQLDNERTFNRVLESIELNLKDLLIEDKNGRDESYLLLKENVNNYLDGVESLLVTDISKSSHKFFGALSDVEIIQNNVEKTITELESLNKTLNITMDTDIKQKIEHIRLIIKKKNVEKLEQGLLQVKLISNKVAECQKMFANDQLQDCMQIIQSISNLLRGDDSNDSNVQKWTEGWPFKLLDLKTVPGLIEIRALLTNMKIEIGGKYSLQLSDLLLNDLKSAYEDVDVNDTINKLQQGQPDKIRYQYSQEFNDSIKELITKLNDCEELASSFSLYQEKITTEVKNIIKHYLPREDQTISASSLSVADRSQSATPIGSASSNNTGSKLSKLLKEQTPMEFQNMLQEIYIHCLCAIKRLYSHQKMLLDISLREINTSNVSENQHNMISQLDIRTGVNEIIRIIQLRMGKIIAVRRDLTSTLRHDHFLRLYAICILFIQECEALSGEFLTKYLSDVLASQIKHYISIHDSTNVRIIQKKIELENWIPVIVSPHIQTDVNDIVSSIDIDPINWTSILLLSTQDTDTRGENYEDVYTDGGSTSKPTGNRKSVVVGDKTFVASESLLQAIQLIRELLILSTNLPTIYLPYFERMCFNMLKYFNNYAMGTITNSQDQTISAQGKNLSIMGESIDCLAEFIDIVQRFYLRQSANCKDFVPYDGKYYIQLAKSYDTVAEKIYLAHAPPPPV